MAPEATRQTRVPDGVALLRDPNIARLFGARLVSMFGSAMAPIAIAFGVLEITGSAGSVGVVVASMAAAQVLFQLFAGALADRGSRKRMIIGGDLLGMASQGVIAASFLTGRVEVSVLCVLMAVNGIAISLIVPSLMGIVPQIVPEGKLQSANALLGMAQSGAMALGAAVAGLLVATVGAGVAIAIDAATFGVSAALVAGLRPRPQARIEPASLWADLAGGWVEFTRHRWLWTIVVQFSLVVAAWEGVVAVAGPTVAKRALSGASDWGWIMGAVGLGTLAGAVVALRVRVERPMLVATCFVFTFALPPLLLLGPAPRVVIALGGFVAGLFGQMFGVLWNTTVQTRVAPDALSRVAAYDHVGSIALAPMGIAATGWILESVGPRPTLLTAAAMILLPTFVVLCVPEVRQLRTTTPRAGGSGAGASPAETEAA